MKKLVFVALVTVTGAAVAQDNSNDPTSLRSYYSIAKVVPAAANENMVYTSAAPPNRVEGTYFLVEQGKFATGAVQFKGKEQAVGPVQLRLNLKSNDLEVETPEGLRAFSEGTLKSFMWKNPETGKDEFFVGGSAYKIEGVPLRGFIQIVEEGKKAQLVKRTSAVLHKPEFNPMLVVESTTDKILKDVKYYVVVDNNLVLIPKSKKKISSIFKDHQKEVAAYVKQNGTSPKSEEDLAKVVRYYNSL